MKSLMAWLFLMGIAFGQYTPNGGVKSISLTTPSILYTTPVNFTITAGAATGALTFISQPANSVFGNFTGGVAAPIFSAAPTFSGANLTALNAANVATGTLTGIPVTGSTGSFTTIAASGNESIATGSNLYLFNTADQTTNYERGNIGWAANVFTLSTAQGGTGTNRDVSLATPNNVLQVAAGSSTTGSFKFTSFATGLAGQHFYEFRSASSTATSGSQIGINFTPAYNQPASTAANSDLVVNRTETSIGSGAQFLAQFQVSGADKFSVDNKGNIKANALPVPVVIASVGSINAKTVANTLLYTVPTGKTLVVTGYVVRVTAATAITVGPAAGVGSASGTSDIAASQAMNALTTTTTTFNWPIVGMSVQVVAAGTVYFNLGTAATGTSQTLAVDVIGYLY